MATHAMQFIFHGFTGFRWPVVFFATCTASATHIWYNVCQAIGKLDDFDFTIDYCLFDGASTNRSMIKMCFPADPREDSFIVRMPENYFKPVIFMQDIKHVLKKIRNGLASSLAGNISSSNRYLILNDIPIVWNHWLYAFLFNERSHFQLNKKLTPDHIDMSSTNKMRNQLACEVLDGDMLHLMELYQQSEHCHCDVASSIVLLRNTSVLVKIFSDTKHPISDGRLAKLKSVLHFFNEWESAYKSKSEKRHILTQETRDDINGCIGGFLSLCSYVIPERVIVTPGNINSDLVENFFCQERGICHGLNTNPTIAEYGPAVNSIILGQDTLSHRNNTGTVAQPYCATTPCSLNPKPNKKQKTKAM